MEFDKSGCLVDEILFSHKEKDDYSDRIICYPLKNISTYNNTVFSSKYIHKKLELISKDANDFQDNELNQSIIKQIETKQNEDLIISVIEGGYLDYKLSLQEKKLIKNSDCFILSGRAGTGKTTVI